MYTIEVRFRIEKTLNSNEQLDTLNLLLGAWRNNGQILGEQFPIAQGKVFYAVIVNTPEKSSLSHKFDNKYTSEYRKTLCTLGLSKPTIKLLGKEPEGAKVCRCKTPSHYILFTTYISLESPLRCADCFGVIPLYRIPKTYDDEFNNVRCWQSDYQSCDSLQMNCTVGERFGTNQISRLDSALTRSGLKVCSSIHKVTKKKTYYYLYSGNGKSYNTEISRKCPRCKGKWYQKKPMHHIFDFMCKKCGLLSNIAWNISGKK